MSSWPYDVKFTVGAESRGFMCVTPPGESKSIAFEEVNGPDSLRVGTYAQATHQDFDPKKDTVFAMGDWSGGIGQLEFTGEYENRCWWAVAVLHVTGKVFLPPPATSKSLSSATTNVGGFRTYINASTGTRYDFTWVDTRLYRRPDDSSSGWTLVYTQPNGKPITDVINFNGALLIAVPTLTNAIGGDYYIQSDPTAAATWTPTLVNTSITFSDANGRPKRFLSLRGTAYALVDNRKVFYSTDPSTDGWIGPIDTSLDGNTGGPPGDNSYPFQALASVGDYMMVFKWDGGWSIDANQDVAEIFWQWKGRPSPKNFEFVCTDDDLFYFNCGNEAFAYDPPSGKLFDLGLAKKDGFSTKEILGLASDNKYVYVLAKVRVPTLRSADSVALLRGWRPSGMRWNWECLWEDTTVTETYYGLGVSPSGTASRVYWGYVSGGATSVNMMEIPAEFDESTSGNFATAGTVYTSIARSGFPGLEKRHIWLTAEVDNVDAAGPTVDVAYSVNNGASFSSLGSIVDTDASFSYDNVHSRSIVLRFTLNPNSNVSPVIRSFDHHQRIRFRYLRVATVGLRIADNLDNLSGNDGAKGEDLMAFLEELRTTNEKITYEDFLGRSFPVSFDYIGTRPTRHVARLNEYEQEAVCLITQADKGE